MLYERVIIALLKESKTDTFAKMIVQKVIRGAKKYIDNVNKKGAIKLRYVQSWPEFMKRKDWFASPEQRADREIMMGIPDTVQGKQVITVNLILQLMKDPQPHDIVHVGGSWSPIDDQLTIEVVIGSTTRMMKQQHLSMIQAKVYEVVRHELEHSVQPESYLIDGMLANNEMQAVPEGSWSSPKALARYFLSPSEIEAYVAGLYHKARRTRQPLIKLIDDQIEAFMRAATRKNVNAVEMRNVLMQVKYEWIKYAQKRYPKAQLQ